jgi:hypothetical protein
MISRVWLFADGIPRAPEWLAAELADLGVTDVVLPVTRLRRSDRLLSAPRERIVSAALALRPTVDVHLLAWLRPQDSAQLAAVLPGLAEECGARSVLLDAEGPWNRSRVSPRPNHAAEWAQFRDALCIGGFVPGGPIALGVTSYSTLTRALRPIVPDCTYVLPQAYRARSYAPGDLQLYARGQWAPLGRPIVLGLWAAEARWRGVSDVEAMRAAWGAAEGTAPDGTPGLHEVAYWSHKHLVPSRYTRAASRDAAAARRAFLRDACVWAAAARQAGGRGAWEGR